MKLLIFSLVFLGAQAVAQTPNEGSLGECDSSNYAMCVERGVAANCSNEKSLSSTDADNPISIRFINNHPQSVKIFWLDYNGKRVFYKSLRSGKLFSVKTYMTHPWVVTTGSNQCLGIYLPDTNDTIVTIR